MDPDKAMLNSEEIKPVALSIAELYMAGDISSLVSQSVNQHNIVLNLILKKFVGRVYCCSEDIYGLGYA